MSTTHIECETSIAPSAVSSVPGTSRILLALAVGLILVSATLAAALPIGFSIITVFLFAGPHNWLEARYMLSQMPARWGKLRVYFLTGILGAMLLTGLAASMPLVGISLDFSPQSYSYLIAAWNSLLLLWILTLSQMRAAQNPRRNWQVAYPLTFALIAVNWLYPTTMGMLLVYLHPLVALAFLDRELARRDRLEQTNLQTPYRQALLLLPLAIFGIVVALWNQPNLPGDDLLSQAITHHAGESAFGNVSTHMLVALHTFLEMLHYGVWVVAIPLLSIRRWPWQIDTVPLTRRSPIWRQAILGVVALGAIVMLVLWGSFLADYPLTRNLYFTVAMLHVLAEVPFLLRLL